MGMYDNDHYLVCSVCKRRFVQNDKLISQISITMSKYKPDMDMENTPIMMPVFSQNQFELLDTFHVDCLK